MCWLIVVQSSRIKPVKAFLQAKVHDLNHWQCSAGYQEILKAPEINMATPIKVPVLFKEIWELVNVHVTASNKCSQLNISQCFELGDDSLFNPAFSNPLSTMKDFDLDSLRQYIAFGELIILKTVKLMSKRIVKNVMNCNEMVDAYFCSKFIIKINFLSGDSGDYTNKVFPKGIFSIVQIF